MKGVGTFRRALLTVAAALGLTDRARARVESEFHPPANESDERTRKPRKRRRSGKHHTHPRKDWPVIYWGDCPAPVSRKVLKKIASNHPLLTK